VQVVGKQVALGLCFGSFALTLVIVVVLTRDVRDRATAVLLAAAAVLLLVAVIGALVRPTVATLQRNWGILIFCAIAISAGWLRTL
jgi:hypothetical protein